MDANYEPIEKEAIAQLHFPHADVLNQEQAILQRKTDLERAQALGNLEHSKMRIYFEDDRSKKMVETTVWAVTDQSVILKQGVGIPINRIYASV